MEFHVESWRGDTTVISAASAHDALQVAKKMGYIAPMAIPAFADLKERGQFFWKLRAADRKAAGQEEKEKDER